MLKLIYFFCVGYNNIIIKGKIDDIEKIMV